MIISMLSVCEESYMLKIFYMIKVAIQAICIVVPIILIVIVSMDLTKNLLVKDKDEISNSIGKIVKRIIAAIAVFLVPTLVGFLCNMIGSKSLSYVACYQNATPSKIAAYKAAEDSERAAEKAQAEAKRAANIAKRNEAIKNNQTATGTGSAAASTIAGEIIAKAKEQAYPLGTSPKKYDGKFGKPTDAYQKSMDKYIGYSKKKKKKERYARGVSCSVFVCSVVRSTEYDKSWPTSVGAANKHATKSSKWKKVKPSEAQAGDIFAKKNDNHILIYGGKVNNKYLWYQANYGASGNGNYGYASYGKNPAKKTEFNVYRATGTIK